MKHLQEHELLWLAHFTETTSNAATAIMRHLYITAQDIMTRKPAVTETTFEFILTLSD